ncbi:phosphotransferase [Halotia wernerae UHCC 0503]|nr:phosphotransferase [Halotia wernerae UHCC 0503]
MALNPATASPILAGWLIGALGANQVQVARLHKLSGGAIQENWAFDARVRGGKYEGVIPCVLRTDAPTGVAVSHSRAAEYAILKAAFDAGVKVPEPLGACADAGVIGKPFYVMRRLEGTALGHILTDDRKWSGDRATLARDLGAELAKLHKIAPPRDDLSFLKPLDTSPALASIGEYRAWLDTYRDPRPALEFALRWLELNAPAKGAIALCHRDFRTGNYMADDEGLTGILDWEFAGWSDPDEDLGWFCAKCWRFGRWDRAAGGIGAREDFLAGYGRAIAPEILRYWEIMAHARWAVIALQQGERFVGGGEASLDLALTGRRIAELEFELLNEIAPDAVPDFDLPALPGDRADALELLGIARDALTKNLLSLLPEEKRLDSLMVANALSIAGRELEKTATPRIDPSAGKQLVAAIRAGKHDADQGLAGALRENARARTALTNPKYPGVSTSR